MRTDSRIYVAGHRGMVGSAILRRFRDEGYGCLITDEGLDLRDQASVRDFMEAVRPQIVVVAAAKVGGIHANATYPAEFIYDNLMIEANLIEAACRGGVDRLLFLGSSCIYPRLAEQPMCEAELLTGPLEPTNEPYAIAKIAGIKLCESFNRQYGTDYRSLMPTNLYGPGDRFDDENSHVIPALISRIHRAKQADDPTVTIWGTGLAKRDFLHVDDLAGCAVRILSLDRAEYAAATQPRMSHVNVGSGCELAVSALVEAICQVVGYRGAIHYDTTKPDGAPRKLLDINLARRLGWEPAISLSDGLASTYAWYLNRLAHA